MTKTVLCFGDSNTHGTIAMASLGDLGRFDRAERWPGVLQAGLGDGWHVIEEGHPGRTTVHDDPIEGAHKNGLAVLPALLQSHRPVDLVIVMLGTNDLKVRFPVTAFDIARSVIRLCDTIAASGVGPEETAPEILVVSPVPIEERGVLADLFAGGVETGRALAGALQDQVAHRVFDAGSVAAVDPVDGVHLTAEAHLAIGQAITTEVKAIMGGKTC